MVASHSGATDIAMLLEKYGADPSQRDEVVTVYFSLSLCIYHLYCCAMLRMVLLLMK